MWHTYICCHFRPFFALLPYYWPPKLKFGKNAKNTKKDIILFTQVCHKWRSDDAWFLRYKVQRTEFWSFTPPNNSKNQNFGKIKKKHLKILPFYLIGTKNHDHILYFLPLPLTTLGIRILKKWKKKTPGDVIILHKWN